MLFLPLVVADEVVPANGFEQAVIGVVRAVLDVDRGEMLTLTE
jgi:hypothetical protein